MDSGPEDDEGRAVDDVADEMADDVSGPEDDEDEEGSEPSWIRSQLHVVRRE